MNANYNFIVITLNISEDLIHSCLGGLSIPLSIVNTRSLNHINRKVEELQVDLLIMGFIGSNSIKGSDISRFRDHKRMAIIPDLQDRLDYYKIGFDEVESYKSSPFIIQRKVVNLLRMGSDIEDRWIIHNNCKIDTQYNNLQINGVSIALSGTELAIIMKLISSKRLIPIEVFSEELSKVKNQTVSVNHCRVIMHRLKRKIKDQSGFTYIKNRKNYGYYLSF